MTATLNQAAEAWKASAVCAQTDPELWFPENGRASRTAKQICRETCSVQAQCLQYALDNREQYGVWGGYTETERRAIRYGKPIPQQPRRIVSPNPDAHGSYAMFRRGCKCPECRRGYNAYQREYHESRRIHPSCEACGDQVIGRGRTRWCSPECRKLGAVR